MSNEEDRPTVVNNNATSPFWGVLITVVVCIMIGLLISFIFARPAVAPPIEEPEVVEEVLFEEDVVEEPELDEVDIPVSEEEPELVEEDVDEVEEVAEDPELEALKAELEALKAEAAIQNPPTDQPTLFFHSTDDGANGYVSMTYDENCFFVFDADGTLKGYESNPVTYFQMVNALTALTNDCVATQTPIEE